MKLSECGEDRAVREVMRGFKQGLDVRVGPGDDCAVIVRRGGKLWELLKTDCVVEGIHFEADTEPRRIGAKALARAISDIAAMGGVPGHALITAAVSGDRELAWLRALYAGMRGMAERFGVSVVGGELSRSPGPAFISVALTGSVEPERCVTRGGGRAGDLLYVTGRLGGSIAGRHLDFIPRVEEARWLTQRFAIRAMMDLSDGLGADLPRLARASGTGFHIIEEALPRTAGASIEDAIRHGEDYELLFAIAPADGVKLERAWRRKFPKVDLTRIGGLTEKGGKLRSGYDHFAQR